VCLLLNVIILPLSLGIAPAGPGLEQGYTKQPNVFTIHSHDADGHPMKNGGDDFAVNITGPAQPQTTVRGFCLFEHKMRSRTTAANVAELNPEPVTMYKGTYSRFTRMMLTVGP